MTAEGGMAGGRESGMAPAGYPVASAARASDFPPSRYLALPPSGEVA